MFRVFLRYSNHITDKFLREAYETNGDNFPIGVRWTYEPTTGTSGLRKHIKNVHLELYKRLCAEHHIKPSDSIVERQTTDEAPILPAAREPFNKDTLLRYIRNFVIADDQVSLKSSSTSFNLSYLTDCFSLSMLLNAQSFEAYCFTCERTSAMKIFVGVTNSIDQLWRPGTAII